MTVQPIVCTCSLKSVTLIASDFTTPDVGFSASLKIEDGFNDNHEAGKTLMVPIQMMGDQ